LDADDRANELYWGSDHSVNQIADELDLSKGALYEMIRPLSAGVGCPLCGAEVVHPNRTAKDRGRMDCTACGWDGTEEDALPLDAGSDAPDPTGNGTGSAPDSQETKEATDSPEAPDEMYPYDDFDEPGPPPVPVTERNQELRRLVAGGALIGAAVGLALVIWARRR
jgi:hypothetical protein